MNENRLESLFDTARGGLDRNGLELLSNTAIAQGEDWTDIGWNYHLIQQGEGWMKIGWNHYFIQQGEVWIDMGWNYYWIQQLCKGMVG